MKQRPETTAFVRKRLPHWEVADGRYFVTLCQRGAIPVAAAARIRRIRSEIEALRGGAMLEHRREILREMEAWLDRSDAKGNLTQPEIATILLSAIEHRRESEEWRLYSYVVMPNHVHLFIKPLKSDLFDAMVQFKRWTGGRANKILGKQGSFWAREWFDHWSRTPEEDQKDHGLYPAQSCESRSLSHRNRLAIWRVGRVCQTRHLT